MTDNLKNTVSLDVVSRNDAYQASYMNMKIPVFILFVLLSFALSGCKDNQELVLEDKRTENLYDQFHGKYRLISSHTSSPIDVDQDGSSSDNLMDEIPEMTNSWLEIRVIPDSKSKDYDALFCLFWPEQEIRLDLKTQDPVGYEPNASVAYLLQSTPRYSSIKESEGTISVTREKSDNATARRWSIPEEVVIEGPDQLKVVTEKLLYTKLGWQTVIVTAVYERFVKIT